MSFKRYVIKFHDYDGIIKTDGKYGKEFYDLCVLTSERPIDIKYHILSSEAQLHVKKDL